MLIGSAFPCDLKSLSCTVAQFELCIHLLDVRHWHYILPGSSRGIRAGLLGRSGWRELVATAKAEQAKHCVSCRVDDVWDTLPFLHKSICGECLETGTWQRSVTRLCFILSPEE